MRSIVLVTVSGDAATVDLQADVGVPLADLVPTWAHRCSSRAPEDLVVAGDDGRLFEATMTLADVRAGYGSVLRLVTLEEARQHPVPLGAGAAETAGPVWGLPSQPPPTNGSPASPWGSETYLAPPSAPDGARRAVVGDRAGVLPAVGPHAGGAALPATMPAVRRFWRALRAGLSPSVASPPTGAFAIPTRPSAGQRYRSALQATDRAHNLDVMIRSAPLSRCMVVAVVSPKGGPGKTTVTALLGMLLAELRRDPVVALDANPDLGDLSDKLGGEQAVAPALVDDLARWLDEHPSAPPAELWSRLGNGPHGLRYIPTPRPPRCSKERMIAAADFGLYQGLISRLRDYAGIILVDCGTGLLDAPVRAALEAADQIVLITDSSATTARQVVAASGLLPPETPTWLVANKMPQKGSTLDLGQVVAAMARLSGVTVLPTLAAGRLAENIVTPAFTWSEAPAAWQEPVRELAARLADNWRTRR